LKHTKGNILKLSLALGLGVLIIWLSLKDLTPVEKENILNSFRVADYSWVFLSMVIGVFSHLTRAIRWKILLRPMGYNPSVWN